MSKLRMKLTVVAILLLCAALSMGCLEEKQAHVQEMNEKYDEQVLESTTELEVIAEPAKLVIKSIKAEDEGIVFKIKNEGQLPAEDTYFAVIGIDFHPVYDENLRWHHNISDEECLELINGIMRDSDFELNTHDFGRNATKKIKDPICPHIGINVSGESLHLVPLLYKDYIDVINPGEMVESNMYVYWDHDRYIKVLYDGSYNIYEYKLYDSGNYDVGGGNFKSIIS